MSGKYVREEYRKFGGSSLIVTPDGNFDVWLCVPKNAKTEELKQIRAIFDDLRKQRGKRIEELTTYISRKHNACVEAESSIVADIYYIYIIPRKKSNTAEKVPYRKQNRRNTGF